MYRRPSKRPGASTWGSFFGGGTDRNRCHPVGGQFTQQDPIGIAGGLNLYGYAGGDPINFSDPFGLWCPNCVGALIGAAVGGGLEVLAQKGSGDWNLPAIASAAFFGGLSGLVAPGSAVGKIGAQAAISFSDGMAQAALDDNTEWSWETGLIDAASGAGGELIGNFSRALGSDGRQMARIVAGESTLATEAREAYKAILDERLSHRESFVGGLATGFVGRVLRAFGGGQDGGGG